MDDALAHMTALARGRYGIGQAARPMLTRGFDAPDPLEEGGDRPHQRAGVETHHGPPPTPAGASVNGTSPETEDAVTADQRHIGETDTGPVGLPPASVLFVETSEGAETVRDTQPFAASTMQVAETQRPVPDTDAVSPVASAQSDTTAPEVNNANEARQHARDPRTAEDVRPILQEPEVSGLEVQGAITEMSTVGDASDREIIEQKQQSPWPHPPWSTEPAPVPPLSDNDVFGEAVTPPVRAEAKGGLSIGEISLTIAEPAAPPPAAPARSHSRTLVLSEAARLRRAGIRRL